MTVKVEDFFNSKGGADMLDKLAAYLYIDISKIRIANIRNNDQEENETGEETYATELEFEIIGDDDDDDDANLKLTQKRVVEQL